MWSLFNRENKMSEKFVAVLMGSDSDLPTMQACLDILKKLDISYEVKITSAHRTPGITHDYVKGADKRGCGVFIAAAGLAAHLAGAVAAATTKPVIGVPMNGALEGMDSLLSTVQMPGGIPVATVAIGKHGAKNSAYLAAQILATADESLATRLINEREANSQAVQAADAKLQEQLKG